ncbi:MAG: BamA/TamA family outer membrane protein, partial [Candidatus Aegiribacteria sp.]|nr:BamA/TamA family outer membrane protein [Candidatus Aegiribacteria sp.]
EPIHEAVVSDGAQYSEDAFQCSISPYTPRLTIDYASAMASYDSYLGISGYTQFILSDILAHHQIVVNTNLNGGSLSDVDVAVFYGYLPHRTDFVFGLLRQSYRHLFRFSDGHYEEVRDVDMGGFTMVRYPFSQSFRISGSLEYRHLDRTGTWNSTADLDEDILSAQAGVVFDNALWGSVGPRVGSRLSVVGEYAPSISGSASYSTVLFDLRNYLWVSRRVTFATRLAGGTSWGSDAQNFFLGGSIPHRLLWGEVDTIDELLGFYTNHGDILRGYDYASIQGRRYGLFSAELRVPFVNTLALDAPLPLTFRNGRGVMFFDLGCAFDDLSSFHGASTEGGYHLDDLKMGLGIGYRFNLGYFLLKHDIAWRTDLRGISRKPQQNITIGAEF